MVKKCRGLPLAAKTLGCLMHSKKDERDWVFMRDNEILNIPEDQSEIFSILKLSYDHLPSHLKQCFSYCAIFPKDYIIKRETLIRLWMAEGFIQPYEGNDKLTMEVIGNDYFFSLLGNSLLQDIEINVFGDVKSCKMHDLVHDLAQTVSGPHECMIVKASKIGDISEVRRLHLLNFDDEMLSARVSDALKKAKKLRTLFVNMNMHRIIITTKLIKELFHNTPLLRVLDLSETSLKELPSEIGNLKHLRYLDVSFTGSSYVFVKLPNSISTLYNLQTLKSADRELPKDTNKLINLRHVISSRGHAFTCGYSPGRLGQLTCLRTLKTFTVSNCDGNGIEELGSLNSIGGDLTICDLGNVKGGSDVAKRSNLEGKPNLRSLRLRWRYPYEKDNEHEMVLEGLQPHPHLKSLDIAFFGGATLPTWMGLSSCLPNLVVLKLLGCEGVEQLPSLGELPLLRILSIQRNEGVRCLGKEFHGTAATTTTMKSKAAFPSLKEFALEDMINLEEWVVEEQQFPSTTISSFHHLENLRISDCPRLKVVPTRVFPSLTELFIHGIKGGMTTVSSMVTRNLTSLTKVQISGVEELQFLPQGLLLNNSALQSLEINFCTKFEGFVIPEEEEDMIELLDFGSSSNKYNSSLKYLKLDYCPVLTFLPDLRYCTSLRKLKIERCTELTKAIPDDEDDLKRWVELQQQQFLSTTIPSFPHLTKLKISECPRLKLAPTFFPFLKDLYVREIKDMIVRSMVTRNLTSLTKVYIHRVEELQFLPLGLLLNNTALQSLDINYCFEFEGFVIPEEEEEEEEDSPSPDLGSNNSSLKSLRLFYCPVLMFLPDLCYFTSLRSLEIGECKELTKSLPDEASIKKCLPSLEVLLLHDN